MTLSPNHDVDLDAVVGFVEENLAQRPLVDVLVDGAEEEQTWEQQWKAWFAIFAPGATGDWICTLELRINMLPPLANDIKYRNDIYDE